MIEMFAKTIEQSYSESLSKIGEFLKNQRIQHFGLLIAHRILLRSSSLTPEERLALIHLVVKTAISEIIHLKKTADVNFKQSDPYPLINGLPHDKALKETLVLNMENQSHRSRLLLSSLLVSFEAILAHCSQKVFIFFFFFLSFFAHFFCTIRKI
jgi:hypothetical protein